MMQTTPAINKRLLLAISMVSSFLSPFTGNAVNIALPDIGREFSLSAVGMSWVSMAFLLASAVALVPIGKLADMYGRKKIFLIGNAVVILSTSLCAIAWSGVWLIVFRVIQGIGGAMIFGTTMAIVTSAFQPGERGRIIGFNVTSTYIGLSLSPILGGFITQVLGWRSLFLITLPFLLFAVTATLVFIKTEWKSADKETFDFGGSVVYVLAMSAFMFGFSKLPDRIAILIALAGFAGLIAFVMTERKVTFPVLNTQLFLKNKVFAFSNLAALINYAATFAIGFVLSLYLQYTKGLTPAGAGLILITQPVCMALFASVAGRMSDSYDSGVLASVGMAIIVIGLSLLAFLTAYTTTEYLVVSLIVLGSGFGLFSSPNTNSVMGSVEKKYLGIASATVSTMRLTGQMMSMGIATLIIHVFIGTSKINALSMDAFLKGTRVTFLVFAILCLFGVFASLARGKKPSDQAAAAGNP